MNDNVSISGAVRERVMLNRDIMINFELQHVIIDSDMPALETFIAWALLGGSFQFYPNAAMGDFYNCVDESTAMGWKSTGPKKYSRAFRFRVLQDSQAPSDLGVILRRFYGVTP